LTFVIPAGRPGWLTAAMPVSPQAPASRWQVFSAAPHRPLFLAGAAQLLLVMALWLGVLASRTAGLPFPVLSAPPAWVHAFLAIYGLFPFFVFGFLLTVYPRWMGGPPVATGRYVTIFALLVAGMALYYLGLITAGALVVAGVGVFTAGWILALVTLLAVYRASNRKGPHERALNFAMAAGALGLLAYGYALAAGSAQAFVVARALGLWLFLGATLFAVSHRMIPFFGQGALQNYPVVSPAWSLPLALVCLVGHALLEMAARPQWLFVFDLPLALVALQHSIRWDFRRSLTVRLLGMLHIAFAWFGVAMALYGARGVLLLAGIDAIPERAPLHALGIGFVTGMLVAMASRVTLGHSGRELWADNLTWYGFLGVNAVAVLRVAAEFAPTPAGAWLNLLAAAAWLVFLGAWVAHYAPIYLRPRADGRPG
jgi:uncharacterized protein involved in response to NO